jgi:chemotaxis protein CheZ
MGHSDRFTRDGADAAARAADEPVVWGAGAAGADEPVTAAHGPADGAPLADATPAAPPPEEIFHRIGMLTRTLHDAIRELGYHETLADARDNLPDARDRLAYIARLTGDAAEKVLNSVDRARQVQDEMSGNAQALRTRWAAVAAYTAGSAAGGAAASARATPAGAALVEETCAFLAGLAQQAESTNAILTDIMMAQDFHDLTGQVIRKVVNLASVLEEQLVKLLIDATPGEQRKKVEVSALEGPVVNPETRTDVVTDQAGVDDLLASLGF